MNWIDEIAYEHYLLGLENPGKCEYCIRDVAMIIETPAMTRYAWDGEGENPNRDKFLCITCAHEHQEYWDMMWADYYSSIL